MDFSNGKSRKKEYASPTPPLFPAASFSSIQVVFTAFAKEVRLFEKSACCLGVQIWKPYCPLRLPQSKGKTLVRPLFATKRNRRTATTTTTERLALREQRVRGPHFFSLLPIFLRGPDGRAVAAAEFPGPTSWLRELLELLNLPPSGIVDDGDAVGLFWEIPLRIFFFRQGWEIHRLLLPSSS